MVEALAADIEASPGGSSRVGRDASWRREDRQLRRFKCFWFTFSPRTFKNTASGQFSGRVKERIDNAPSTSCNFLGSCRCQSCWWSTSAFCWLGTGRSLRQRLFEDAHTEMGGHILGLGDWVFGILDGLLFGWCFTCCQSVQAVVFRVTSKPATVMPYRQMSHQKSCQEIYLPVLRWVFWHLDVGCQKHM